MPMKRRFILSLIFLFSIGAGIGLASTKMGFDQVFREQPVAAYEMTSSRGDQQNTAKSDQASIVGHPDKLETAGNSQPTAEETATPSSASEMVENLNNKAISTLPIGWIHIREEKVFDRDTENNGVFPNGVAIPTHQINDIWYRLDGSHQVVESVTIMRSGEGKEIQVGVYSDGSGWNSATGVVEPSEPYVLNALDGQFLWNLNKLGESGLQPQITEEMLPDGRQGLRFVIQDKFPDKPLQLAGYKLPVIEAETRTLFSQDDGYLYSKEVIFRLLDGSERVSLSLKQEITFEEPSAEVLSYLEIFVDAKSPAAGILPGKDEVSAQPTSSDPGEQIEAEVGDAQPEQIAAQVQEYVDLYTDATLKPGWLHIVYETRNFSDQASDPLENGLVIPSAYLNEEWINLGADGVASEVVSSMLTLEGDRIQTSVYRQGVWRNLELGVEDADAKPVRP